MSFISVILQIYCNKIRYRYKFCDFFETSFAWQCFWPTPASLSQCDHHTDYHSISGLSHLPDVPGCSVGE